MQNTANSIDTSACDREEIRFPGAVMPHGAVIVLDRRSYNLVACAEHICDYLDMSGKYAGDIVSLLPQDLWQQLRTHTGGYVDRFTLANRVVIDVYNNPDDQYIVLDIERVHGPIESTRENPLQLLAETRRLQERFAAFMEETDTRQVVVNTIRDLIDFDMVQFLIVKPDGTMQTVAEASNGHYPSFLDKRFPRSDVPDPARRNIQLHDTVYVPDIDYQPIPLVCFKEGLAPSDINLAQSRLRSLAPMCNRFYLNVGVHAKLAFTLVHKNNLWGMVIAWHHKPKNITPKNRLLCRTFLDGAGKQIMVNRDMNSRNTFILQSNYVDDFLDELQRSGDPSSGFANLASLLLKIIPCCGAAVVTEDKIFRAGLCPENSQLRNTSQGIHVLTVQNDNAAFYIQEPYKTVRLSGFMALPLIPANSYIAIFRREELEMVTWAGDPKKPVEIDEVSGIKRLTARGSFQAWKEEIQHRARPWERVDIDIFQRLVNGLNSLLGSMPSRASKKDNDNEFIVSSSSLTAHSTESRVQISGANLAERTLKNTLKMSEKKPSVLIIESDFLSAAHLEDILRVVDITCEMPPNPQQVTAFLSDKQYDIIFLAIDDTSLPWQSLIDTIVRDHPASRIIAMCNRKPLHDTSDDKTFSFITRPILATELYETVLDSMA